MLIFRRTNCIHTASGIVGLCKCLHSTPVESGKFCNHSTEFLVWVGNRISQFDVILSHMMNKNIITFTNEIVDPIPDAV